MQSLFLTDSEVAELTGIKRARNGVARHVLQCKILKQNNIPFFTNIKGEPKISREYANYRSMPHKNIEPANWHPAILSA